jgi:hypothetical protein
MMILLLLALLHNPSPSWDHVTHVCHELRHCREHCSPVPGSELTALGYDPARDQGIAFLGTPSSLDTIWVSVFNNDRVDVIRLGG